MVAAVLSGNRNFEGRINPLTRFNYLASPPLVVAYALAGRMDIDFNTEPLGVGRWARFFATSGPSNTFAAAPLRLLVERSHATVLSPGRGLPGQVWESDAPVWLSDVLTLADFPRADAARAAGLHAAVVVPVRSEGRTVAVIECLARARLEPDERVLATLGRVAGQLGIFLDRRRAERALAAAEARNAAFLTAALDCVITMDHEGRVVDFNPAAERTFGYRHDEVIGREMAELIIPPSLRERHREGLKRYLVTGEGPVLGSRLELTGMRRDGTEFPVELSVTRLPGQPMPMFAGQIRDITARERSVVRERFRSRSIAAVAATLDPERALTEVARLAVPDIADWCSIDLVEPDGRLRRVAIAHTDSARERRAWKLAGGAGRGVADLDPATAVIRTGEPRLAEALIDGEPAGDVGDPEELALLRELQPSSAISVPFTTAAGRTLGVLHLLTAGPGRRLERADLDLAIGLATRSALAIDNARLFAERSHIAETLQRSLLPSDLPAIPGIELASVFRPAGEGLHVGGDFYDVFPDDEGGWAIALGDITGKGAQAAATTGLVRYTLRAATLEHSRPAAVLERLNSVLRREQASFCTVVYARLRQTPGGASLALCSGGHPLPLLAPARGPAARSAATGRCSGRSPIPRSPRTTSSSERATRWSSTPTG